MVEQEDSKEALVDAICVLVVQREEMLVSVVVVLGSARVQRSI
jgi:hypothetical protein